VNRTLTASLLVLSGAIGLIALLYPLAAPALYEMTSLQSFQASQPGTSGYALLTTALIGISLLAMLLEVQGQTANAKIIAALGVLVAITSVLRLIETAIPGIGGFSPVFVPIILAGYVFGSRFGFLMGTLSILTSAIITAGIGPWLPYQMFVAGWVGVTAGLLPHPENARLKLVMLAVFAFAWGMLYGGILNLYFWPFVAGENSAMIAAEGGIGDTLASYGAFYMATSFVWDISRSLGNIVLIIALGIPAIQAMTRFRDRFHFELV
jgi:energy-coupling factor transport system substrate-specific component